MIIKNGTKLNGIPVDSTSILTKGRVNPNVTIKPTSFTIHNTSNPEATADGHRRFLLNHNKTTATGAETSWHFTVDDVRIVQHMDTHKKAYHAGKANNSSIGIEVCEFSNATKQAKAIENAKILLRYLMNELKITTIYTHKHWTGKNCPRVLLKDFEGFKNSIPRTITINGATSSVPVKAPSTKSAVGGITITKVGAYTFSTTDKHIGIVEVLADKFNIREKADLNSKVVQVSEKGDGWKVYAIQNGLYKLAEGKYCSSNSKYVKFYDNPYLDDKGKALGATNTTSNTTSSKNTTKLVKVKVNNLYTYNSANWNDKGDIVNANEVFTVVKELTVSGAKMYQLKSGKFITANTKYVELV